MKPLSAGLTLVNVATVTGLLLGILGGGLNDGVAGLAEPQQAVVAVRQREERAPEESCQRPPLPSSGRAGAWVMGSTDSKILSTKTLL